MFVISVSPRLTVECLTSETVFILSGLYSEGRILYNTLRRFPFLRMLINQSIPKFLFYTYSRSLIFIGKWLIINRKKRLFYSHTNAGICFHHLYHLVSQFYSTTIFDPKQNTYKISHSYKNSLLRKY